MNYTIEVVKKINHTWYGRQYMTYFSRIRHENTQKGWTSETYSSYQNAYEPAQKLSVAMGAKLLEVVE